MQKEYEFKITMLEKKIKEKDERIKDARKTEDELERLEQDYNELKEAHSLLEKDYKSLQMEADDLAQDATKLVQQRKEYDSLMADYKKLKLENEDLALCVKTAENDVIRVQSELNISKNEHQMLLKDIQILKEKMRLAEAEKESYILQNERSQKKMERNIPLHTPISGGTVNESLTLNAYDDPEFERYQQVSSKLLAASKSDDPSSVLPLMREILLACKAISQSCERKQDNPSTSPEDKDNMENAMARFSERLGSLMKAAKAHASEGSSKTEEAIALETKKLTFSISDVYELLKAEDNRKPSARVDSVRSKRETLRTDANTIQPFTLPELQVENF